MPSPSKKPKRAASTSKRTTAKKPAKKTARKPAKKAAKKTARKSAKKTAKTPAKKAAPAKQGVAPTQADIRARARKIWNAAGQPEGQAFDHWIAAEKELYGERGLKY